MTRKERPTPIVTYINRAPTFMPTQSEREKQAIHAIAARDVRIASLEFSLKEVRRILTEEPSEIGTAIRIIANALEAEEP